MHSKKRRLRQAVLFFSIALGLSTVCALVSPCIGPGILFLTMFTPAIAVVVCRITSPERTRFTFAELGLSSFGFRHWPIALILPLIVLVPGYLVIWTSGAGHLSLSGDDAIALKVFVSFVASTILGATLGALGEEVGWRGYLLPRLIDPIGVGPAGFLSGFLHGLWHVPLIVLTPYYHADLPTFAAVPLFMIAVTLSGPIFAHLRLASASIVPVALMHHAWNSYWNTLDGMTASADRQLVVLIAGEGGIMTVAMLAIVAFCVMRHRAAVQDAMTAVH